MRNYYFTSVWVFFLGLEPILFCVPCLGFCIYLSVSGFEFSILLVCIFFRVLHVFFRVLNVCFVLRASRKTFSFFKIVYDSILYFVILVLVLPFWNLSFCFGFWGFGFACMLFFRVLDVYFPVLNVCFVLRASRKTFSFNIVWFYFLFCDSGFILCFRFESVFLFWVLVFLFGFCGYVFSLSATIYLTAVFL